MTYYKDRYSNTFYDNIHNIINPGDVVPQVPMYHDPKTKNGWDFVRFGVDHYFPSGNFNVKVETAGENNKLKSKNVYGNVDAKYYTLLKEEISSQKNVLLYDEIEHIIDLLVELVGDREYYSKSYAKLINVALHKGMSEYGVEYRKYAREILGATDKQIDAALVTGDLWANTLHNNIVRISWIADFKIGELLYKVHDDLKWICALTLLEYGEEPLVLVNQSIIDFVNDVSNRAKILFESCPRISISLRETAVNVIEGAASTIMGYLQLASKKSGVVVSHQPAFYASWLYSFTSVEMCALFEVNNPLLTVACPVDIYFYDTTGAVVASVVDDTIINTSEDIVITLVDDVKTISFPDDTYRIEIVPVAEGSMDVAVANLDNTGSEVQKQYFNNITLNTSLEYELIRTVDENGTVTYQLLDSYNQTVADESTITGDIQTIHTQIEVIGNGAAVCEEYVSPGTYITLTAVSEKNEAFIGWYIGSELVSTSEAYSFFANESQTYVARFTENAAILDSLTGDLNGDGVVDTADVALISDWFAGKYASLPFDTAVADFNGDGMFTRADGMYLARAVAGWDGYKLP